VVGANANADIAAQLKASLAAIGTVAIPRTPAEIAQALAAMQDSTGPFASFVFLSQSSTLTAGSLVIRGSIKASSNAMYPALRQAVRDAASHVLDLAAYTLTFVDPSFPSMTSDPRVSANAAAMLARAVGDAHVLTLRTSWPFNTEDFALFLEYDPGAMFLLGVANPAKGFSGVPHSPDFDADEDAILIGTKAMTAVIWQRLSGG
jgi:metal-dependent amidase/aminoacylase/carboxypeptidase family protein